MKVTSEMILSGSDCVTGAETGSRKLLKGFSQFRKLTEGMPAGPRLDPRSKYTLY